MLDLTENMAEHTDFVLEVLTSLKLQESTLSQGTRKFQDTLLTYLFEEKKVEESKELLWQRTDLGAVPSSSSCRA